MCPIISGKNLDSEKIKSENQLCGFDFTLNQRKIPFSEFFEFGSGKTDLRF